MALKQDNNNRVAITEALSIRVGRFLKENKYAICDGSGDEIKELYERGALGILYSDPAIKPVPRFFGLITPKLRRLHLGDINFENKKSWTFRANGRENLELIEKICNELSEKFDVNITIYLVREKNQYESSDW